MKIVIEITIEGVRTDMTVDMEVPHTSSEAFPKHWNPADKAENVLENTKLTMDRLCEVIESAVLLNCKS